jgi:hypothetical protein
VSLAEEVRRRGDRQLRADRLRGRGRGDVFASHDLEDIIAVVDGRPEIVSDVATASRGVREYISGEIHALLASQDFIEALFLPDAASQARGVRFSRSDFEGSDIAGSPPDFCVRTVSHTP